MTLSKIINGIGRTVSSARIGSVLFGAILLAGCVRIGSEPPPQFISLTPDARLPAGAMSGGSLRNAIVVLDPDTSQRLDVTRVPVQIDASSIAYLQDAYWVERPARQFRRLLAETIRAEGKRIVVEGSDYELAGNEVLSGRLVDMGYDAAARSVVVRYDALLGRDDGFIRSHRFEAVVPGIPPDVAAVAPALNQAANQVAREVADWVSS